MSFKIDLTNLAKFKIIPEGDYESIITGSILVKNDPNDVIQIHFHIPSLHVGFTKKYPLSGEREKLSQLKELLVGVLGNNPGNVKTSFIPAILYKKKVKFNLNYYKDHIALTNLQGGE